MSRAGDRRRLALAFVGCAICTLPLVVAPRIVLRIGLDFNRMEDGAHAVACALAVITLTLLAPRPGSRRSLTGATLVVMAAALIAELVQLGVPGRSAAPADVVYDGVGVTMGVGFIVWSRSRVATRGLRTAVAALLVMLGVGTLVLVQPV